MRQFDMGAAWDDTVLLLRSHSGMTIAIAAVFMFLPPLAMSWFGPVPVEPAAGESLDQLIAGMSANIRGALPGMLIGALFSAVGGIAILRLWLARSGVSVGEAIFYGLTLLPTMIGVQLLTGLMMGIAILLLIVPGLYLMGRLAVVTPVVADSGNKNPLAAIQTSWELTKDNGWMIFLFLFLIGVVTVIALLVFGAIGGIFGGGDTGRLIAGALEAFVTAVAAWVSLAVAAAIYRQLSTSTETEIFS